MTAGATQPLDALENLPKERPGQVAVGRLEGELPRLPDQSSAGLEQALPEARERPILDGDRQDEPAEGVSRSC
jgi:hypothetical protein